MFPKPKPPAPPSIDVDFDKDIDVTVDVTLTTESTTTHTDTTNIDSYVTAVTCIEGNTADVIFDIEAVGTDTFTSLDISVLTFEDQLSSITGSITSAVD
ncbi:hypothetical protein [Salipiger mangrovisoli]|uniref:Uncharacterized protein n=1 Tax=Salipiger mangrovisoli TaxID=2865933 RepID=A0ABR9WY91_9RHOB|nr:hypothetical protein [Salipiger mangrovisoli]MBE9636206.1 hypothetical protein [Salipiger mangrovisoli]